MVGGPKVSVVLPTYNQALYLPKALDSVFGQTFRDFELIIVNDGSTDATASILAEYQAQYSFTLIEQENQGLPMALKSGFKRACGAYLTWTSSDNIMMPDMLEVLSRTLDQHAEVGLVYADWYVIDETDQIISKARTIDYDRSLLFRDNYINACFMYRRECQDKVGFYDPDFIYTEDWEYWLRISRFFKMLHVPEVLYKLRQHSQSLTQKGAGNYRRFASYWIRTEPLAWYYSKLKWHSLKWKLGRNPTVIYQPIKQEDVESSDDRETEGSDRFRHAS